MSEETVGAASSAASEDVFGGENVSLSEFSKYRESGEIPARFKPAETVAPAPTDAPEETVVEPADEESESEPESEPEDAQEQPQKGSGAEKRIKQLLAEKKELQRKLEAAAKPDVKTEPSTVQPSTQEPTKPKADDKDKDGKPKYETYEDFVEALADWKSERQIERYKREQAEQQARQALQVQLDEARSRYEDADDVIIPTAQRINEARIPEAIKQVFADSDVFPDLCYVVGSDPDELTKFLTLAAKSPRAALAKVFEYERGIHAEFAKTGKEKAEPVAVKAPERKQTTAPKPPSLVGGSSARAFDVNDESLSPEEWMRKRNADLKKRG